jgi:hypothetical protein
MGFDVTISKLQHIQHIDDIFWGYELVYNAIAGFIISALALATFCAFFLEVQFWKETTILLIKKKHNFIYLSYDATCKIKWSCY